MSHLDDARVVLVDGPVAVYLREDTEENIMKAWERLRRLVLVASDEIEKERKARLQREFRP